MYKCKECEFMTESASIIGNHYKYSHRSTNDLEISICSKCKKVLKSKGGLTYHLKFCNGLKVVNVCPKCNFTIKANFEKHLNYCDGRGPRRKRPKQGFGWSKGLTKDTDNRVKKISDTLKSRIYPSEGHKHSQETRAKLSLLMNERYKNGWESTAGRCKKLDYVSPSAGTIKVDGNWELNVAIYLDSINLTWTRNKKRFSYFNKIKNKISTYCPDFFVKDWNCYIEVKGYKTELDEIKWSQFESKLEIWDKIKLNSLGIDTKYKRKK